MGSAKFTAVLEHAEEGGFVIKCVELPIATQGETKQEALANLREAIEGYLEVEGEKLRKQTKGERVEVIVEAPSALMAWSKSLSPLDKNDAFFRIEPADLGDSELSRTIDQVLYGTKARS